MVRRWTVGRGTTFVLYLPRRPVAAVTPTPPGPPSPTGGGELVLLVEDDPLVLRSTHRILRAAGYRVVVSESAERALALVDQGTRPDLVLSDVRMPGLSGFQLVERLTAQVSGIRCLMMSGYVAEELQSPDAWTRPMIAKPFGASELVAEVRRILTGADLG